MSHSLEGETTSPAEYLGIRVDSRAFLDTPKTANPQGHIPRQHLLQAKVDMPK